VAIDYWLVARDLFQSGKERGAAHRHGKVFLYVIPRRCLRRGLNGVRPADRECGGGVIFCSEGRNLRRSRIASRSSVSLFGIGAEAKDVAVVFPTEGKECLRQFSTRAPVESRVRWNETAGLAEQDTLSARTRGAKETSLMKKSSKATQNHQPTAKREKPGLTVGLDLGDRFSRYCLLNQDSEVIEEGRIATTKAALERHFAGEERLRIALECGTHSLWVSRLLEKHGARSGGRQHAQDPGDHRE
jgi:hypothetical protein